jgi:hypothetical protein
MAPKVFSRLTGPVNSALNLVENTGSTALRTGDRVWRSLGNGTRRVVRKVGSSGNNAIRRLVTGKGGRRRMNRTRKNRKNRK